MDCPYIRYGLVTTTLPGQIPAYLPDNYSVLASFEPGEYRDDRFSYVVISGKDYAGWTLHGYVIPRLLSGLHGCEEIDLSHEVMKQVPA